MTYIKLWNLVLLIILLIIPTYSSLKFPQKVNEHINRDLKLTIDWIRANKLSSNAIKTEIVIFKARNKTITKNLNLRISGQKLEQSCQV